jgi:hypothetical protein
MFLVYFIVLWVVDPSPGHDPKLSEPVTDSGHDRVTVMTQS